MARRVSSILPFGNNSNDSSAQRKSVLVDRTSSQSADQVRARSPARLQKVSQIARRPSDKFLSPTDPTGPTLQDLQEDAATEIDPVLPPPPIAIDLNSRSSSQDGSRPSTPRASFINYSRPGTPNSQAISPAAPTAAPAAPATSATEAAEKNKKKFWWSKNSKKGDDDKGPLAWIAGHPQKVAYDVEGLMSARPMQELCDETDGNCFVYLFPRMSNHGASFKIDSAIFASSPALTKLAFGDIYSSAAILSAGDRRQPATEARGPPTPVIAINNDPSTPPLSPKRVADTMSSVSSRDSQGRYSTLSDLQEAHLYLPIKLNSDAGIVTSIPPNPDDKPSMEDMQTLIDYRNFFAFLCGQSLVATERRSTFFAIFMVIAAILKSFQFSNVDGSTFGEVANSSFDNYVEELSLADVRTSREKTIEGIVLGERMKSVFLYNEAFTHAAGKLEDLAALKSAKYSLISPITQNRLTRASMDLEKRVSAIRLLLTDFEFPFLFSGIMASKKSEERKEGVRFEQWKESFLGTRKYVLGLYKHRYGDWPPRASSKKNNLETSGLNRLVLRDVYRDMTSMYDLLVDRSSLTTRTIDGGSFDDGARDPPVVRGLRAVLSENDRSVPPVKPPIPFDLPKLPTLLTTRPGFNPNDKKDTKVIHKKLKDDEISKILRASWNDDAVVTPFVDAFREMEKRAAHNCSIAELEDLRIGQWIFMHSVLQALPMLACDAPGLNWTKFVEYFLCEPPRSGVPWVNPSQAGAGAARRTWFSVGGAGGGVVSLPADAVEHSVEGIYRRSHCWQMAEQWTASNPILNEALHEHQEHQHHQLAASASPSGMNTSQAGSVGGGSATGSDLDLAGLPPPPSAAAAGSGLLRPDSRSSMRSAHSQSINRHSSLGIGLEALPMPAGVSPNGRASSPLDRPHTPKAAPDSAKTFDAILGTVPDPKAKVAKGKKK